jgi:hypothetical protein
VWMPTGRMKATRCRRRSRLMDGPLRGACGWDRSSRRSRDAQPPRRRAD